jgi:predicted RNA binding protein YcfA (HicA-like mRNA interferase family)
MVRGVSNWTFSDVTDVLKEQGFVLNHIRGSHYFYVKMVGGQMRQVCVPKHGSRSFKPRTLKGMIMQSGLSKQVWGIK